MTVSHKYAPSQLFLSSDTAISVRREEFRKACDLRRRPDIQIPDFRVLFPFMAPKFLFTVPKYLP